MFKHLFKLIWNKKTENFLLISEILISFLVIFAVMALVVQFYHSYNKPMGFDYEQVWTVDMNVTGQPNDKDSIMMNHENLKKVLTNMPQVRSVAYTASNTPFNNTSMGWSFNYKKEPINVENYNIDEEYKDVLKMEVVQGRWFSAEDKSARLKPIVINTSAAAKMNVENPVGLIVEGDNKSQRKVIGVVADVKYQGNYRITDPSSYSLIDTAYVTYANVLILKVSPDANADFEGRLYKLIANTQHTTNLKIEHLSDLRHSKNRQVLIPSIILIIVSSFLIINVALGLFGVLWYNISKRRGEFGLRRAIGASAASVSWQMTGEAMVLATFSLIIGSFFAVQFPLLNVFDISTAVYMTALVLSIGFIYLLVIICALYPGKQASAIQPAVALHED